MRPFAEISHIELVISVKRYENVVCCGDKTVLPMRFSEKVGFFLADGQRNRRRRYFSGGGGGVRGHAPPENF